MTYPRKVPVDAGPQIAALYRAGQTQQQIGDLYGVTRERVRQILAAQGIDGRAGGQTVRTLVAKVHRQRASQIRRDQKYQRHYGCDYATLLRLNEGKRGQSRGSLAWRFHNQRQAASHRKIEWSLSFVEWMEIWLSSGKLAERGQGRGRYCMARKGDTGPYSADNVYITTCDNNVRDYQAELKTRGVVCADGYTRLPEKAGNVSRKPGRVVKGWGFNKNNKRNPYQAFRGDRYLGCFPTPELARAAYLAAAPASNDSEAGNG